MKLDGINFSKEVKSIQFNGRRIFRNNVAQLAKNNPYSLTEPNQRLITNSIAELAKVRDSKNINFLLSTAAKNKYSTNIELKTGPKNPWKEILISAAVAAASITPALLSDDLIQKIKDLANPSPLNKTEKSILNLRKQLLKNVDLEQINNETKGSIKNFETNLDTFITSSETTQEHKKYVLERLNYLMSENYEINPQLTNKKSIVVAEMINDMAFSTSDNEYPNIKLVNQKQHGMCAAISIVRKKIAYEDKPNYVDSILSELDASDYISVYDRNALGTGKKVEVSKIRVDFDTAIAKGYRIIDASTMHWMQIAQMSGESNLAYNEYIPFDKENFDVKTDNFLNVKIDDPELEKAQNYYQALIMAKSLIKDYKADLLKNNEIKKNSRLAENSNHETMGKISAKIRNILTQIEPNLSSSELNAITAELLNLEKPYSNKINKDDNFSYIPNEEEIMKEGKVKSFLEKNLNKTLSKEISSKIYNLVSYYNSLANETTQSSRKGSVLRKNEELYQIAAAFRYQIVRSLEEKQTLDNIMVAEKIPSKEILILNHIDTLIEKLETESPHTELILEQASKAFSDDAKLNAEDMAGALRGLKVFLEENLSEQLDLMYEMLGHGSRKEALITYLNNAIDSVAQGDKETIKIFAETLGTKNYAPILLQNLSELKQKVENGGEKEYIEVFHKIGNTSQIEHLQNLYQHIITILEQDNEESRSLIVKLLEVNNLPIENNEEAFVERLNQIEAKISAISNYLETCSNVLRIVDKDGDVLFSSKPEDIIIKKLENENRIASSKALRELQNHFIKIVEDRSSDEFQSRQGKLKDKSLYEFSPREKETLKETEKSINIMYSYIQKQLNFVTKDMKNELEDLKRIIGVNDGHYWVREGGSGLYGEQQIRLLEYMTGRPHYETSNFKKAIEKIKTTPYSGISSSSVFHNKAGWHAQYVADIEPVKVKVTDNEGNTKEVVKDVLFHDNTWGASENENTWIDSYGLKRTDYSNNRGGTLGYITNSKFRNGNLVDRILGDMVYSEEIDKTNNKQYKKIKHPDTDGDKTPQYNRIILDGRSPETKSVSDKIHDALFVSNANFIGLLKNQARSFSVEELDKKMNSYSLAGTVWKPKYEELKRRIFPEFGKGIKTEEDYNKLADDDYLKVVLEKMALKKRYQVVGLEPKIALIKNVKDLQQFEKSQKLRAINSFKYAFGKTAMFTDYAADAFGEKEYEELEKLYSSLNINLTDEEKDSIGTEFIINSKKYDGSMRTSINLIMESLNKDISKVVIDKEAAKKISNFFRNYLVKTMYFNKSDLNMYELENQQIEHIIKFIDRVFDPIDDDEFVEIYRNIQNMTEAEFKQEILSKATLEDLGFKNITGYDILKQIQRHESKANNDFLNEVFYDNLVTEVEKEEYDPSYRYEKLHRVAKYTATRTLESLYRDIKYDLSLLNMEKLFNKYKGRNLKKYDAYPAYPKIEHLNETFINSAFNELISLYRENIAAINGAKIQKENYEASHRLAFWAKNVEPNVVIKGRDYAIINELVGKLITQNMNDESMEVAVAAANEILSFDEGHTWGEYFPFITTIVDTISYYENITPESAIDNMIETKQHQITENKNALLKISIQPKYYNNIAEDLNNIERAYVKNKRPEEILPLLNKFQEDYKKYHIFQDPETVLKQYIKSCAEYKDAEKTEKSDLHQFNGVLGNYLRRLIDCATLAEIQEILMEAVGDGLALNAKTKFNKHFLGNYSMDSDEMITQMVNMLVLDKNIDTAIMFLEKLGLNERYVNFVANDIDFEELKNFLTDAHVITQNFENFANETTPVFNTVEAELKKANSDLSVLDGLAQYLENASKRHSLDDECLKILLAAINDIQNECKKSKKTSKDIIFNAIMGEAKSAVANILQAKVEEKDKILNANSLLIELINSIRIEEGSDAEKARITLNQKAEELYDYRETLLKESNDDSEDEI